MPGSPPYSRAGAVYRADMEANTAEPSGEPAPALHVSPEYRPQRADDVFSMDMGDGLILYNRDSQLVHHLNPTAAVVWGVADGEATVATLAAEIAEQYELDPEETLGQLTSMLGELDAMGLVHDADAESA